jgi:hypothetical protein
MGGFFAGRNPKFLLLFMSFDSYSVRHYYSYSTKNSIEE